MPVKQRNRLSTSLSPAFMRSVKLHYWPACSLAGTRLARTRSVSKIDLAPHLCKGPVWQGPKTRVYCIFSNKTLPFIMARVTGWTLHNPNFSQIISNLLSTNTSRLLRTIWTDRHVFSSPSSPCDYLLCHLRLNHKLRTILKRWPTDVLGESLRALILCCKTGEGSAPGWLCFLWTLKIIVRYYGHCVATNHSTTIARKCL